jgi:hypothetical protein
VSNEVLESAVVDRTRTTVGLDHEHLIGAMCVDILVVNVRDV